jgi:hypothetical protein
MLVVLWTNGPQWRACRSAHTHSERLSKLCRPPGVGCSVLKRSHCGRNRDALEETGSRHRDALPLMVTSWYLHEPILSVFHCAGPCARPCLTTSLRQGAALALARCIWHAALHNSMQPAASVQYVAAMTRGFPWCWVSMGQHTAHEAHAVVPCAHWMVPQPHQVLSGAHLVCLLVCRVWGALEAPCLDPANQRLFQTAGVTGHMPGG